jgi:signal transduction histidine kinase
MWLFVLLALIAVVAYLLVAGETADERTSAAEINLAGKRRMLSQRIGLLSSQYLHEQKAEDLQELKLALRQMAAHHDTLRRGDPARGIHPPRTPALRDSYTGSGGVDAAMQTFLALGEAVVQQAGAGQDFRESARHLTRMSQGEFLGVLDRLVGQYQAESEKRTDMLRLLQWSALMVALGLLTFSALGVLKPLIAQVRRTLEEQQASEKALRQSELKQQNVKQRLVDAIEALDDAFALFDADDRLALYNLRFTEAFPLRGEIIAIGMPFSEFVRAIAAQQFYDVASERLDEWVSQRMAVHQRAEGSTEIPLSGGRWLRATERRTREGGTVVIWSDVSHLKQALIAAAQASHAKSEFMARMSHELRTPLNAILGFAQVLDQGLEAPLTTRQMECVSHILHGGRHLLGLINEILDLSAIEAGRLNIDMENLPLASLLKECLALISPLALDRQVTLSSDEAGRLCVQGDRQRLKQALLNLLSNGIKYNRVGGRLTLSITQDERLVRLTIVDTGHGIPPELARRVFQPFDRLGASNVEGTGIGLSITKKLVDLMGGRIGFDSTVGVGTAFWVELNKATIVSPDCPDNVQPLAAPSLLQTIVPVPVALGQPAQGAVLAVGLTTADSELLRLVSSTLRGALIDQVATLDEGAAMLGYKPYQAIIAMGSLIDGLLDAMPEWERHTPVLIALSDDPAARPSDDARIRHWLATPLKAREIARLLRDALS